MNHKHGIRIWMAIIAVVILFLMQSMFAMAYFDRGPVGISLGQSSITLAGGEAADISVAFSPASSDQLPGCGMAECPQT